jgi:hypothetical protein
MATDPVLRVTPPDLATQPALHYTLWLPPYREG